MRYNNINKIHNKTSKYSNKYLRQEQQHGIKHSQEQQQKEKPITRTHKTMDICEEQSHILQSCPANTGGTETYLDDGTIVNILRLRKGDNCLPQGRKNRRKLPIRVQVGQTEIHRLIRTPSGSCWESRRGNSCGIEHHPNRTRKTQRKR